MNKNEDIKKLFKGTEYENKIEGLIEPEDEIEFECIRCGKCCTGRDYNGEPIMVSPLDIYNGCKELGITPEKFIKKYTKQHTGPNSGAVILTLACRSNGDCKFLEYDENHLAKCKIHKAKPTICAIHPLGIMHGKSKDTDGDFEEKHYILAEHCESSKHGVMTKAKEIINSVKGTDEEVDMAMAVRTSWLPNGSMRQIIDHLMLHSVLMTGFLSDDERKELGYSDHFYKGCLRVKDAFENTIGPINIDKANTETLEKDVIIPGMIENMNMHYSYMNYDVNKPFLEQAKENLKALNEISETVQNFETDRWKEITGKLSKKQIEQIPEFMKVMPIILQFSVNP